MHQPVRQFIRNFDLNLLYDIKEPLFLFFKGAFKMLQDNECNYTSKLSDVARLWLKFLQPWSNQSDFVEAAVKMFSIYKYSNGSTNKKDIDFALFSVLTHESISVQR